mmetsp:Transcript_20447/g.51816  ORF Transcript_20447/g.51816 Transcript_20447/m.51816 type:complete len:477 (-) Transcript_20447:827-2257(-)
MLASKSLPCTLAPKQCRSCVINSVRSLHPIGTSSSVSVPACANAAAKQTRPCMPNRPDDGACTQLAAAALSMMCVNWRWAVKALAASAKQNTICHSPPVYTRQHTAATGQLPTSHCITHTEPPKTLKDLPLTCGPVKPRKQPAHARKRKEHCTHQGLMLQGTLGPCTLTPYLLHRSTAAVPLYCSACSTAGFALVMQDNPHLLVHAAASHTGTSDSRAITAAITLQKGGSIACTACCPKQPPAGSVWADIAAASQVHAAAHSTIHLRPARAWHIAQQRSGFGCRPIRPRCHFDIRQIHHMAISQAAQAVGSTARARAHVPLDAVVCQNLDKPLYDGSCCRAHLWLKGHAAEDEALELRVTLLRDVQELGVPCMTTIGCVHPRLLTGVDLPHQHTSAVQIRGCGHSVMEHHLRRHVERRASREVADVRAVRVDGLAEPKVCQLGDPASDTRGVFLDEDVVGLEVAVHDALGMQVLQA